MKTKISLTLAILALLIPLAMPLTARADNTRLDFTASQTCPGPNILREWMASFTYHATGISSVCRVEGSIPEMTGYAYSYDGKMMFVGNNFMIYGKFRLVTDEGGVWKAILVFPAQSDTVQVVGHGEGIYEGREIRYSVTMGEVVDTIEGFILK